MARAQAFDYLHNMRFHVSAGDQYIPLSTGNAQAGFSAVTIPEASVETVEYREGQYLYTRKYPGHVTFNNITMSRGVAVKDTTLWEWMSTVIRGDAEYRTELQIKHYHRADTLPGATTPAAENLNLTVPAKTYTVHQAFPVRCKPSSDLDATDSAVSISELEIAYEYMDMLSSGGVAGL